MTKKLGIMVFAMLFFGTLAFAGSKTWTGTVSDSNCGTRHSEPSAAAATCVENCVHGGASYVLVSQGKIYRLAPQAKFKGLGGTEVKVTGELKDGTIEAAAVSKAGK